MSFDNVKYQTEYIKTKLRRYEIRVNREKESDMMDFLESKENVQAYLKELIRKDMKENSSRT